MALPVFIIPAPVTGDTPSYRPMIQPAFECHAWDDPIEGHCLDAPLYLPTGVTIGRKSRFDGKIVGQADFKTRPGTYVGGKDDDSSIFAALTGA